MKAIHSPHTGIVDWGLVTRVMGEEFCELGGEIRLNQQVESFKENPESVTISTKQVSELF